MLMYVLEFGCHCILCIPMLTHKNQQILYLTLGKIFHPPPPPPPLNSTNVVLCLYSSLYKIALPIPYIRCCGLNYIHF